MTRRRLRGHGTERNDPRARARARIVTPEINIYRTPLRRRPPRRREFSLLLVSGRKRTLRWQGTTPRNANYRIKFVAVEGGKMEVNDPPGSVLTCELTCARTHTHRRMARFNLLPRRISLGNRSSIATDLRYEITRFSATKRFTIYGLASESVAGRNVNVERY